jgi:hypothetical protein
VSPLPFGWPVIVGISIRDHFLDFERRLRLLFACSAQMSMRLSLAKIQIWTALILWAGLVLLGVFWFHAPSGERAASCDSDRTLQPHPGRPNDPLRSVKLLAAAARDLFPWLIFSPGIVALGWNFRFERNSWFKALPIHVACSVALALVAGQWTQHRLTETLPPKHVQLPTPNLREAAGGAPHQPEGVEFEWTRCVCSFSCINIPTRHILACRRWNPNRLLLSPRSEP